MLLGQRAELGYLVAPNERPSGVVGMHENDGSRPRVDGATELAHVDAEARVALQGVGDKAHFLARSNPTEQGVARAGNQHSIVSVGQQAENPRVGLAGAGRQDDSLWIDREAAPSVVAPNRPPSLQVASRRRFVGGAPRVAELGNERPQYRLLSRGWGSIR